METGGTWCVCAIGSGPDDVERIERFPTAGPRETLERIVKFFRDSAPVEAIGVGSFGPVELDPASPHWGYVTTTPKPGWRHTAVATVLQDALGTPVAFDNDVNAAALAEHTWGAGRGFASLCYLTVGTGIGAGLVVEGSPWHGLVHPEVGHIRVPHDRERDPFDGVCPVHGDCWEGLASGPAIEQRWSADPRTLAGDHPAWVLEADYLALGVLSIVLIASPERVIVGGGVMDGSPLLPLVRERFTALLAGYLESPRLNDDYLVPRALGDRAGVLGAIALAQRPSSRTR